MARHPGNRTVCTHEWRIDGNVYKFSVTGISLLKNFFAPEGIIWGMLYLQNVLNTEVPAQLSYSI